MSNWHTESTYIWRHATSGVINTGVGFSVIILLTYLDITPIVANISGYASGLISGFLLSKIFVFRSKGSTLKQGISYIAAFALAFLLNLGVLRLLLETIDMPTIVAQLSSMFAYTVAMYILSRTLVFR